MQQIPLSHPPLAAGPVKLRAFRTEDVPAVVAALEDGEISRWTAMIPFPYGEADARDWIASHEERRRNGAGLDLAITGGEGVLGAIGLDLDWPTGEAVAGYWVAGSARRRGLATAALRLVCDWAFGELGLVAAVRLTTMDGNVASERVAAKAGFTVVEVIADQDLGSKRATVSKWVRRAPRRTSSGRGAAQGARFR